MTAIGTTPLHTGPSTAQCPIGSTERLSQDVANSTSSSPELLPLDDNSIPSVEPPPSVPMYIFYLRRTENYAYVSLAGRVSTSTRYRRGLNNPYQQKGENKVLPQRVAGQPVPVLQLPVPLFLSKTRLLSLKNLLKPV